MQVRREFYFSFPLFNVILTEEAINTGLQNLYRLKNENDDVQYMH